MKNKIGNILMFVALTLLAFSACKPSYYTGHVVAKDVFSRRVSVEISSTSSIEAITDEDTLNVGDEVKVDKQTFRIVK